MWPSNARPVRQVVPDTSSDRGLDSTIEPNPSEEEGEAAEGDSAPEEGGQQPENGNGEHSENDDTAIADTAQLAQDLAQRLDVGSIVSWSKNILPFVVLLLSHLVLTHFYSIIQLLLLIISTASSTLHLQAVIAAPAEHKLLKSRDVLILVNLNIWALSLLGLPDKHAWRAIFIRGPQITFTFWESMFYAVVSPLLIKQWMIVPKTLLAAVCAVAFSSAPRMSTGARLQTALLTAVEHISIAWTEFVPVTIWHNYIMSTSPPPSWYASSLFGTYLALKARAYIPAVLHVVLALRNVLWRRSLYATKVSPQEALEGGLQCPICQDPPRGPVKLVCGHVFCDKCVAEWLERERTCPMCRSTVRHDDLQSYGNGTSNLLPTVF